MKIDCAIPAGNILIDSIEDDQAVLQKDLRDTEGNWFYWKFRAFFDRPGTYRFTFANGPAIGERGPAVSINRGKTWRWLGTETTTRDPDGFSYRFEGDPDEAEVWFSMAIPYLQTDWEAFLARHRGSGCIRHEILCRSRKGRPVELLRIEAPASETPRRRILLTCRHHACEMMASYVLEGLLEAILEDAPFGKTFRDRFDVAVVPFVDKDGVEDGDQGKYRRPHDHNRDYGPAPIYPETAAIMDFFRAWRPDDAFDFHCPWLHDIGNANGTAKKIHILFPPKEAGLPQALRLGEALERLTPREVPYRNAEGLPFGSPWNADEFDPAKGRTSDQWWREEKTARLVFCIEIPYAAVHDETFTQDRARAFGKAFAHAFLESTEQP